MDKDRAKEILTSISREEVPREEPGVDDALAMLDRDDELQAWFREEKAFDEAVGGKLKAAEAPEGLRDQLVSTIQSARPEGGKTVGIPPVLLAAAAAIVVLGAIALMGLFGNDNKIASTGLTFASFQQDMAKTIRTGDFRIANHGADFEANKAYMDRIGAPTTTSCDKIGSADCRGCTILEWGDNKVAMFCIDVDDETLVHMFVVEREKLTDLPPEGEMKSVIQQSGLPSTGWADDKSVYVIIGHDEKTRVTGLF